MLFAGLVPFWTKRNPDYGSMLKTINCRDDSLAENRGMWNTMKQRKRCIVVCQGFYEWLKKNGGREKIPHFVRRKDGKLMCLAGLWDCAQFEGEWVWDQLRLSILSGPGSTYLGPGPEEGEKKPGADPVIPPRL
jgi:putative SOS response-associated peptidase YedK